MSQLQGGTKGDLQEQQNSSYSAKRAHHQEITDGLRPHSETVTF